MTEIKRFFHQITFSSTSIAPLVVFRILFGIMMFFSTLRFINKGWVKDLYVLPKYHFSYYGFEWIKPLSENGMNILFIILLLQIFLGILTLKSDLHIMIASAHQISSVILVLSSINLYYSAIK